MSGQVQRPLTEVLFGDYSYFTPEQRRKLEALMNGKPTPTRGIPVPISGPPLSVSTNEGGEE